MEAIDMDEDVWKSLRLIVALPRRGDCDCCCCCNSDRHLLADLSGLGMSSGRTKGLGLDVVLLLILQATARAGAEYLLVEGVENTEVDAFVEAAGSDSGGGESLDLLQWMWMWL